MTITQISKLLNAEWISEQGADKIEIEFAKASDLMSDVLAFSEPFSGEYTLLITGLTNKQVVRTCEIAGIAAIVFVRGKNPSAETIELAKQCDIPIVATKLKMFEACGILYANGIKCASPQHDEQEK